MSQSAVCLPVRRALSCIMSCLCMRQLPLVCSSSGMYFLTAFLGEYWP